MRIWAKVLEFGCVAVALLAPLGERAVAQSAATNPTQLQATVTKPPTAADREKWRKALKAAPRPPHANGYVDPCWISFSTALQ